MSRPNNETLYKEAIMYNQDEVNLLYPNTNINQVEMTDEDFLNYEGFFDEVFDSNMGDIGIWCADDDVRL